MSLGLGIKSYIQWGLESAGNYGSGSHSVTKRMSVLPGTKIEAKPQMAEAGYLPAGYAGATPLALPSLTDDPSSVVKTAEWAEGTLEFYLDYEVGLRFFDMLYGTATYGSAGWATTGPTASIYTHTFKEQVNAFNSLQMELIEGLITSGKCSLITGLQVTDMTITGKAAPGEPGLVRVKCGVIGKRKQLTQNITGAINAPARHPVRFADIYAFDDGSGDTSAQKRLREFELSFKPSVANTERLYGGSLYPDQQVRKGLIDVTLKLTREFQTDSLMSAFIAGTEVANVGIRFQDGTSTPGPRAIEFDIFKGYVKEAPQPDISLDGMMLQTVTIKALWSSSDSCACKTSFENLTAAASI